MGLCLALVLVAPVMAQRGSGGAGGEMLQAELDRTDQLIERSQGVVMASGSTAAVDVFNLAVKLQTQAKAEFNTHTPAGYIECRLLTMSARDKVHLALRLVAPGQGGGGNELQDGAVQRRLDQAGNNLDRAQDVISESTNSNLGALYQAARNNLDRAWEFYRSKQYRPALKLADQVNMAAEKILSLAGETDAQGEGTFERRESNVSQLVDRAKQMLPDCQSESAAKLVNQAEQNLNLAKDLDAKQQTGALAALRTARELALKAVAECRGNGQLEQHYTQLLSRLDRAKEQAAELTGSVRSSVDKFLSEAQDQLNLARGFLDQNQPIRAQAALQAARLAIQQAEVISQQGK